MTEELMILMGELDQAWVNYICVLQGHVIVWTSGTTACTGGPLPPGEYQCQRCGQWAGVP